MNNYEIEDESEFYLKKGRYYRVTQNPYVDGPSDHGYFTAHALDDEGNEVMLKWDIRYLCDHRIEINDRVDWDNFSVRKL